MAETGAQEFIVAEQERRYSSPVLNTQLLSVKQDTSGISAGEKLEMTRTSLHFLLLHWFIHTLHWFIYTLGLYLLK